MMKKRLSFVLVFVLMISLFSACTQNVPGTEPVSETELQWDRDANEHWHVNSSGEKVDVAAHNPGENPCSTCGSEIWVYEDGSADIFNYNEQGEWLRMTYLDADGSLIDETTFEYTYDDAGNKSSQKQYYNGVLVEVMTFKVNEAGETVPDLQTGYYDDGTWATNEYDELGNVVRACTYDTDGNVTSEELTEFEFSSDGSSYEAKTTIIWEDGSKHVSEYNQYGEKVLWAGYDADGNLEFEHVSVYEYDNNGNLLHSESYVDEILSYEIEYALDEDGFSYAAKEIIYNYDGTYYVYEYDVNGDTLSETLYDADGNVIEE